MRTRLRRQAARYLWREELAGRHWHNGFIPSFAAEARALGELGAQSRRVRTRAYNANVRQLRIYVREIRARDSKTWDDFDRYLVEVYG